MTVLKRRVVVPRSRAHPKRGSSWRRGITARLCHDSYRFGNWIIIVLYAPELYIYIYTIKNNIKLHAIFTRTYNILYAMEMISIDGKLIVALSAYLVNRGVCVLVIL